MLKLFFVFFLIPVSAFSGPIPTNSYLQKPKLLVVIVVDQFRSDFLTRFDKKFISTNDSTGGGFKRLMEQGAYYPFAQYEFLQDMTCQGHATILSGTSPVSHGISLNDWYDRNQKRFIYCVEDPSAPILGGGKDALRGASPRFFKSSTVGDELKLAHPTSRTVTIALKDRSAILLGGHSADIAVWLDQSISAWTSSTFYLGKSDLPNWVQQANKEIKVKNIKDTEFTQSIGVTLTTDAALYALNELKLGQGSTTDLLALSYSTHDIMGHKLGPNDPQMEELTLLEDREIARLFAQIQKSVGIKNTLIAFTADHGVAPTVETTSKLRIPSGKVDSAALFVELNKKMEKKFGKSSEGQWIENQYFFNFYLNHRAIEKGKKKFSDVANALKEMLLADSSFESAFSQEDWSQRRLPLGLSEKQILASYLPNINGDVMAIPRPFYFTGKEVATHLSGHSYDRSVPLIIMGNNIRPGTYSQEAHITDLAPTLSFLLGVLPPAHSSGRVLSEALGPDSK